MHWWPLALLALAGLFALLARAETGRRAALIGWLFGVGHFTLGLNWIATAFTYQANMPVWLGWIAVMLIAFYLAVFPALATGGAWLIARGRPAALVFALAGCWIVAEWLRSWVATGFPWNPLGAIALGPFDRPGLAMLSGWLGSYGLSGLVIVLAGSWWNAARRGARDWRSWVLVLVPLALLLQPGEIRLADPIGGVRFTLVQPDIRQEILNDPATFEDQFHKLAALSRPLQPGQERLVLWPESGVPDYLRDGYPERFYRQNYGADPALARQRLGRSIGPGATLMTGTADLDLRDGRAIGARNVVTALNADGDITGSYAKAHLVPFGEYLALRWLLEPLGATRLVPGAMDFLPGPGPRTLQPGGQPAKVAPQICYEIIFSGKVVDRANRPDFIFNPSNDGWYGDWGPPQFLAQARLRAIEEGLPVLRATTTGISAVIDADGIVRQHIPRHIAGRLDGFVPDAHAPTLFARLGNMLALGWAMFFLALSLVASRRRHG